MNCYVVSELGSVAWCWAFLEMHCWWGMAVFGAACRSSEGKGVVELSRMSKTFAYISNFDLFLRHYSLRAIMLSIFQRLSPFFVTPKRNE